MAQAAGLKRINVYVNPDDLRRVACERGCRPAEAIRRLIDNYLRACELDEVRRMPGRAPDQLFRIGADYELPEIPDNVIVDPVE
jgi:hypothetical protein